MIDQKQLKQFNHLLLFRSVINKDLNSFSKVWYDELMSSKKSETSIHLHILEKRSRVDMKQFIAKYILIEWEDFPPIFAYS